MISDLRGGTFAQVGTSTTASFEYGFTTSYGSTTPAQNLGKGTEAVAINDVVCATSAIGRGLAAWAMAISDGTVGLKSDLPY